MRTSLVLFIVGCIFGVSVKAQPPISDRTQNTGGGEAFTVYIDNDSRNIGGPSADEDYSNGIGFAYTYGENKIPNWAPEFEGFKDATANYGIAIAQQIYTPEDTQRTDLILNDRPYAGYLYLGMTAAFRTTTHSHLLELDLGIVGPEAMGEKIQNGFHDLIDYPRAQGWENQLATEPALQLSYTQKLRFYEELTENKTRYFDVIPEFGATAGNIHINAHAGAMVRFGLRIPDDFGPANLMSAGSDSPLNIRIGSKEVPWRLYGFAGVKGRAVIRNIFLDGNTFRESHRVNKYPFVAESEFGYAVQLWHLNFSWRFVTVSPEFEENSKFHSYASIALTYLRDF